jgi:phosphatidylglycerophosphate synthase
MLSRMSRGRRFPEPPHPMRTAFQRDRDRIIHSAAFRRLEYKTQVFVNHEGDYYRTRLTHTVEAAQITRTVARALGLNSELAEAVALAHDLGHTPFGHAGERALSALMEAHGGFDHNAQSLRTVDWIEVRYPNFRGLNLTFEVREGIIKHSEFKLRPAAAEFDPALFPCLEAQIVDLADEIAYLAHDVDDGLKADMLTVEDLNGTHLFRQAAAALFLAGFLDMADGQVARRVGRVTAFGAFLDSTLDRYSDLALYMGLVVYYTLIGRTFYMVLAAVAMASSFMVSYSRARAESVIHSCKVGFLERPERLVLLIIGGAFNRMAQVLWVIALISTITVIHRVVYTWQELRAGRTLPAAESPQPS